MLQANSYSTAVLWIMAGIVLAALLVFYIRRCNIRKRLHIAAVALFIASAVYILFALYVFNPLWIMIEAVGLLLFLLFIWMAYRYSFWFLCMGWLLHVVWDAGVHPVEVAPYVPAWYAWTCIGFDVVVAAYIAVTLIRAPVTDS